MASLTVLFIILAAVGSAGLVLFQYYFPKRHSQWILFSGVRFVTYFSLLLLLINPKIKEKSYSVEKPSLVLAVDNSRSIRELGKADSLRKFVEKLKADPELSDKFAIETYTFGADFERQDSLDFDEGKTNIGLPFSHLSELYGTQVAPTILLTDGNQTFGPDYQMEALNYAQPLYPVVVGDTATHPDLKIDRLNVNHYAFLDNKFPIEIFVNYNGEASVVKKFTIRKGGKPIFEKSLNFDHRHNSQIVNAELPADSIGVNTYTAEIESLKIEKNTDNNRQKFAVEVIDEKAKIVVLSAFSHPDLGAFKKAIESNSQRQADIKYIDDDGPIDFEKYQLAILYQPNSDFKKAFKKLERLHINTLTVTGTKTDYGFLNGEQGVFEKELTDETEHYLPVYNEDYSNFQFDDIGFDDFPPLRDEFGEMTIKKDVTPLLYQKIQGTKLKSPLLATLETKEQRKGFLFGEGTWQWRGRSFREAGSFKAYDGFLGKLIQYLSSDSRRERLRVDYKSFYDSGDKILFRAHYFDENYEFDPRAKLSAEIENQKDQTTQKRPFLLKGNHYELDLSQLGPGDYKFKVDVKGEARTKSGEFTVVDFDVEKQFSGANVKKLRKTTDRDLNYLDTPDHLVSQLLDNPDYKPVQRAKTKTSSLIEWRYLLLIMALSLSFEWFLRKYRGLV